MFRQFFSVSVVLCKPKIFFSIKAYVFLICILVKGLSYVYMILVLVWFFLIFLFHVFHTLFLNSFYLVSSRHILPSYFELTLPNMRLPSWKPTDNVLRKTRVLFVFDTNFTENNSLMIIIFLKRGNHGRMKKL